VGVGVVGEGSNGSSEEEADDGAGEVFVGGVDLAFSPEVSDGDSEWGDHLLQVAVTSELVGCLFEALF